MRKDQQQQQLTLANGRCHLERGNDVIVVVTALI